jgi:hypothetical protein
VSFASEHARAGRPKFDEIIAHEVGHADGAIIVTCACLMIFFYKTSCAWEGYIYNFQGLTGGQ